jgi:hypothetical protein
VSGVDVGESLNMAWISQIHNTEKVNLLNAGTHATIVGTNTDPESDGKVPQLSFVLHVVPLSEDMELHCSIIDRMVKGSQPNGDGRIVPPAPASAVANGTGTNK